MRVGRLGSPELSALAGALLLVVGLFLPWYETDPANPNATVAGTRGSVSAWQAEPVLSWLLLALALAPLILAWIAMREHQLSWPRGEMTAVLAMVGLVLVLYVGVIGRPGQPAGAISLGVGWYLAVLGCILECAGGAVRAGSTERPRKPPGVL
jgi:hypothetical protein